MVNAVGHATNLTRLQAQEQADGSSGTPPNYEGRIGLDPILLDVERLVTALVTGVFELSNMRVHQNLLLHHIGRSMARSAVLLRELCNMARRAYRPADLLEISWRDLQWAEIQRRASPSQREELPVREEVVEDDAGVISSVIVPTLAPVTEDAMEEKARRHPASGPSPLCTTTRKSPAAHNGTVHIHWTAPEPRE